jgi:hypothetical protein
MAEIKPKRFCGRTFMVHPIEDKVWPKGAFELCWENVAQCPTCRGKDQEAFADAMLEVVREHVHCDKNGSCDWDEDMLCVLREWGVEPREGEYGR